MNQEEVLRIVRSWNISKKPEYRGFKCARCQKEMIKAWHVWLNDGDYKLEVHFCDNCGKELEINPTNVTLR